MCRYGEAGLLCASVRRKRAANVASRIVGSSNSRKRDRNGPSISDFGAFRFSAGANGSGGCFIFCRSGRRTFGGAASPDGTTRETSTGYKKEKIRKSSLSVNGKSVDVGVFVGIRQRVQKHATLTCILQRTLCSRGGGVRCDVVGVVQQG